MPEALWKIKTPLELFEVEAYYTTKGAFDEESESETPFTLVKDVQFPQGARGEGGPEWMAKV